MSCMNFCKSSISIGLSLSSIKTVLVFAESHQCPTKDKSSLDIENLPPFS